LLLTGCSQKAIERPVREQDFQETPGYVTDIVVENETIYMANGDAGLTIAELIDDSISIVGHWDDPSQEDYARAVAKFPGDTILYIADTDGGIIAINVRDPSNPLYLSNAFGHNIYDVKTLKGPGDSLYVLVADQDDGLSVFDASYPGYLIWLQTLPLNGYAYRLCIDSIYVFVAQGQSGLVIFDFTDPREPRKISEVDLPGVARSVYVQDTLAFVALKEEGIAILDIACIDSVKLLSTLNLDGYAWKLIAKGNRLYVAAGGQGIVILDISNPKSPRIIDFWDIDYGLSVNVLKNGRVLFGGRRGIYLLKES
jgi:hypothetical protein